MLVTFKTDAYADITMFGDVAISLLKMMGHSGTIPSAILAEDVPVALNKLTSAIKAESDKAAIDAESQDNEPPVPMSRRALPLVELLTAAEKAQSDVMWT